jgi:hypothetical protein
MELHSRVLMQITALAKLSNGMEKYIQQTMQMDWIIKKPTKNNSIVEWWLKFELQDRIKTLKMLRMNTYLLLLKDNLDNLE